MIPLNGRFPIDPGGHRILICLPAFNEEMKLPRTLEGVFRSIPEHVDVAVIDDGSTDQTSAVAKSYGAILLRHPVNLGYGASLQTGYKFAIRNGYSAFVQMDSDGQHDPGSLADILLPILKNQADCVIGNRFHANSKYKTIVFRYLGQLFFSQICYFLTSLAVRDPTSGFRAYSPRALAFLSKDWFPSDFPDADVIVVMHQHGLRILEVPVTMHPSSDGRSMHAGILRPIHYVIKMLLSLGMVLLRKKVE